MTIQPGKTGYTSLRSRDEGESLSSLAVELGAVQRQIAALRCAALEDQAPDLGSRPPRPRAATEYARLSILPSDLPGEKPTPELPRDDRSACSAGGGPKRRGQSQRIIKSDQSSQRVSASITTDPDAALRVFRALRVFQECKGEHVEEFDEPCHDPCQDRLSEIETKDLLARLRRPEAEDPTHLIACFGLDETLEPTWTKAAFEEWFTSLPAAEQEEALKGELPDGSNSARHQTTASARGSGGGLFERITNQAREIREEIGDHQITNQAREIRTEIGDNLPGFNVIEGIVGGVFDVGEAILRDGAKDGKGLVGSSCTRLRYVVSMAWASELWSWVQHPVEPDDNCSTLDWWKIFLLQLSQILFDLSYR